MSESKFYQGAADAYTGTNDSKAAAFVAERLDARQSTGTLVKVLAVYDANGNPVTPGSVDTIGSMDVQPLVNMIDGFGNATPHGKVQKIAYHRYAGGPNAIIITPEPGDIGEVNFADRDISSVRANKGKQSNPGSHRRFDMADGIYKGCVISEKPTQYITFPSDGGNRSIVIADANHNTITMDKNGIKLADGNGNTITIGSSGVLINGATINSSGDVITAAGKNLDTHEHTGVTTGSGNTGPPV